MSPIQGVMFMKSCLKRILQIFMTLTLVFLMVIINNDKKIENQENYSIMQKANNITKEDRKTEEKDSFVPKKDENPKADEKQDNEKTKTSENKNIICFLHYRTSINSIITKGIAISTTIKITLLTKH